MSDISQLASRVGGCGGVGHYGHHIIALPGSERGAGRGVAFPPLGVTGEMMLHAIDAYLSSK
jgi:hypothetical protein